MLSIVLIFSQKPTRTSVQTEYVKAHVVKLLFRIRVNILSGTLKTLYHDNYRRYFCSPFCAMELFHRLFQAAGK